MMAGHGIVGPLHKPRPPGAIPPIACRRAPASSSTSIPKIGPGYQDHGIKTPHPAPTVRDLNAAMGNGAWRQDAAWSRPAYG